MLKADQILEKQPSVAALIDSLRPFRAGCKSIICCWGRCWSPPHVMSCHVMSSHTPATTRERSSCLTTRPGPPLCVCVCSIRHIQAKQCHEGKVIFGTAGSVGVIARTSTTTHARSTIYRTHTHCVTYDML